MLPAPVTRPRGSPAIGVGVVYHVARQRISDRRAADRRL